MKITKKLQTAITSATGWGELEKRTQDKVYAFLIYLLNRESQKGNKRGYVHIPSKTLETNFETRYSKITKFLEANNILKSTNYSAGRFCKAYKLDKELLIDDEFVTVESYYQPKAKSLENDIIFYYVDDSIFEDINFNFDQLKPKEVISNKQMREQMAIESKVVINEFDNLFENKVEAIKKTKYKINNEIKKGVIDVEGEIYSTGFHIDNAKMLGFSIIQDRSKYFMSKDEESYKTEKIARLAMSWSYILDSLLSNRFYAKRNNTNYRLDTNFTQMPNEVFKEITKKYDMVELDIKNSQFAILANCMRHQGVEGEDFELFYEYATKGKLYESVASDLNTTRDEAKLIMMEILFQNDASIRTPEQKAFNEKFPTVCGYVRKIKLQGIKLPVYLQMIESHIMLDLVYQGIFLNESYHVIPKHDAVYVSTHSKEEVETLILQAFELIGFECQLNGSTPSIKKEIEKPDDKEINQEIEYKQTEEVKQTEYKQIKYNQMEKFKQAVKGSLKKTMTNEELLKFGITLEDPAQEIWDLGLTPEEKNRTINVEYSVTKKTLTIIQTIDGITNRTICNSIEDVINAPRFESLTKRDMMEILTKSFLSFFR